ncbi:hypothetical protein ACFL0Q_00355 [Thermodesulfobacteriota bacterium]
MLKRAEEEKRAKLTLPEKEPVPDWMEHVPRAVEDIARRHNLELRSLKPDVKALEENRLQVNLVVRGDFFGFRDFLVDLGGLPYLDRIREMQLGQAGDARELQLKVALITG